MTSVWSRDHLLLAPHLDSELAWRAGQDAAQLVASYTEFDGN